ncbi:hypothetical protein [Pseudochrobactrum sp. MP213Fo]|uniref:hypothetical protein n=1 Tax=Pseudochrobactrum sp. MP213Fo TaxID=3022250 RepID=UPI003BA3A67B
MWEYFSKNYEYVEMPIKSLGPIFRASGYSRAAEILFEAHTPPAVKYKPSIMKLRGGPEQHNPYKENVNFVSSNFANICPAHNYLNNANNYLYNYIDDFHGERRLNIVDSKIFYFRMIDTHRKPSEDLNIANIYTKNHLLSTINGINPQETYSSINIIEYIPNERAASFSKYAQTIPSHTALAQAISLKLKMPVVYHSLMHSVVPQPFARASLLKAQVDKITSSAVGIIGDGIGDSKALIIEGPRASLAGAEFSSNTFSLAYRHSPSVITKNSLNKVIEPAQLG